MVLSVPFNAWLVQPGNYRLLREIQTQLSSLLGDGVKIRSWSDLYCAFEQAFYKDADNKKLFEPIFIAYPPTPENGATPKQIQIYRGALVTNTATNEPRTETITVTYRGQTLEKSIKSSGTELVGVEKPARYYRGVKVED